MNFLPNWVFGLATALAEEGAADEAATSSGYGDMLTSLIFMVVIFVVFYFILIRPQRKKDKAAKDMLSKLKVTDRICTIGGIYGTITQIKDDTVTLSVGKDNVSMVFARWAIRSVEDVAVENDAEVLN